LREAQAFLRELFGAKLPENLRIQMWCKADKGNRYATSYSEAAQHVKGKPPDWYVCVSLAARNYGLKRRMPAKESAGIPGLWADIDILGGPEGKKNAAPTLEAAHELARSLLEPTLTLTSGYGLQAWWLFEDGPWLFGTDEEREQAITMAGGWIATLRAKAVERGFGIDATQDLARLMRVPDTVNGKGGLAAPVTGWPEPIREQDGPRYQLEQLAAIAAEAAPRVEQRTLLSTVDVAVSDGRMNQLKFEALAENSPQFKRTWDHSRQDAAARTWTMSEYDQSLASQAAHAFWGEQEIADLIVAHRLKYDPTGDKHQRQDYLARTVAKAKALVNRQEKEREREDALEELVAVVEQGGEVDPDHIISQFNVIVGGPTVKDLIQHGRDPDTARYNLELGNGEIVRIGPVTNLLNMNKFQARFAVVTRHVLKDVKRPQWKAAIQALLNAARVEESVDDTPEGTVAEWLRRYLRERMTEDFEEAANQREPFQKDGFVYIFAENFATFVRMHLRVTITSPDVKEMLRAAGFTRKPVAYEDHKAKKRTTASYYFANMEVVEG
jgi:hypothetical protein